MTALSQLINTTESNEMNSDQAFFLELMMIIIIVMMVMSMSVEADCHIQALNYIYIVMCYTCKEFFPENVLFICYHQTTLANPSVWIIFFSIFKDFIKIVVLFITLKISKF